MKKAIEFYIVYVCDKNWETEEETWGVDSAYDTIEGARVRYREIEFWYKPDHVKIIKAIGNEEIEM